MKMRFGKNKCLEFHFWGNIIITINGFYIGEYLDTKIGQRPERNSLRSKKFQNVSKMKNGKETNAKKNYVVKLTINKC